MVRKSTLGVCGEVIIQLDLCMRWRKGTRPKLVSLYPYAILRHGTATSKASAAESPERASFFLAVRKENREPKNKIDPDGTKHEESKRWGDLLPVFRRD